MLTVWDPSRATDIGASSSWRYQIASCTKSRAREKKKKKKSGTRIYQGWSNSYVRQKLVVLVQTTQLTIPLRVPTVNVKHHVADDRTTKRGVTAKTDLKIRVRFYQPSTGSAQQCIHFVYDYGSIMLHACRRSPCSINSPGTLVTSPALAPGCDRRSN